MDPIDRCRRLWRQALESSPLRQKSACCVSTLDADGFPRGRFVDLKRVDREGFVFCTDYRSPKAREIDAHPKLALTAWWDHASLQVRVVGRASRIDPALADELWRERSHDAHLTTLASRQSEPLESAEALGRTLAEQRRRHSGQPVPRPSHWGGYRVAAERIELLAFRDDRLHERELYERSGDGWRHTRLQP